MTDAPRRRRRWPYVLLTIFVVIGAVIFLFQWDWLIPVIDSRASAAIGRPVSIGHLHVQLGRTTRIVADDLKIDNPANWPGGGEFATVEHLMLDVDAETLLRERRVVLPNITLQRPVIDAQQAADGSATWAFSTGSSDQSASTASSGPGVELGTLVIEDGNAHVRSAKLNADFQVAIATKAGGKDGKDQITADAKGTYAKQPITAQFVGGALLSLRDSGDPYPVDLKVANGPTRVSAVGTIANPLAFAGANVTLEFAGPDMSLLLPLTGIAIPKTPPYRITGKLDYSNGDVKFEDFAGRVGSSDLEGNIDVDTKPRERPVLTAALHSKLVDLKDLGGFIGAEPGDADKGTKKPVKSTGKVLPSDPISLPKLNVADVHLRYTAAHIEGRHQPLDNMRADLDIVNGEIALHPLSFGIGPGKISGQINLAERSNALAAKADVEFERVDVDKLLEATGAGRGAGAISGRAIIDGSGRSMADILGHGNGELKLSMGAGGNLSALLVDLSGLEFGNALLSALGVPNRTKIECLVTDFVLKAGVAESRLTMLDTDEARMGVLGGMNLQSEALSLQVRTESKHFSIGSLPTPIDIGGTMGSPSIRPDLVEGGARAAAAVGLGVLLTPLAALLPTIQFGTGEDGACAGLLREVKAQPPRGVPPPGAPAGRKR